MSDNLVEKFKSNLRRLIGEECWGVTDSAGSYLSLDFGAKISRIKPVGNINLSQDVNRYEAEFSFMILCAWRIESKERVICGAWSENKENIKLLLGQKVTGVMIDEPFFDLALTFSNGCKLKVFCDSTNELDEADNYDFFTDKETYGVEMNSHLIVQSREIEK